MTRIVVIAALLLTAGMLQTTAGKAINCGNLADRLSGKQMCHYESIAPVYVSAWGWLAKVGHCTDENRLAFCDTSIKKWRLP